jgi:hypothetical protein
VINLAVRGYSTWQMQPDWFASPPNRPPVDSAHNISRALALRPSAIILNLPTNDFSGDVPLKDVAANFRRILAEAANTCVPVWVTTTQPRDFSPERRLLLQVLRDWLLFHCAPHVLDFWTGLATADGFILPAFDAGDGIHLNSRGHAVLFERVRAARIPARLFELGVIVALESEGENIAVVFAAQPFTSLAPMQILLQRAARVTVTVRSAVDGRVIARSTHEFPRGISAVPITLAAAPPGLVLWEVDDGTSAVSGALPRITR